MEAFVHHTVQCLDAWAPELPSKCGLAAVRCRPVYCQ